MNPNAAPNRSRMNFDAPAGEPTPRPEPRDAFELDTRRVFYMRSSKTSGAYRHTWDAYVVDHDNMVVDVIWSGGLKLELSGSDAVAFLRIVRDRSAQTFDEAN